MAFIFYHPDHLGSATWITNSVGTPVEYIHYMPYGELWVDQQATGYSERFKFTGKERDSETGYDYFGARYYSYTFPMWLSVDPLSDKYPELSPYAYCNWNPIKYVDPTGKDVYRYDYHTGEFSLYQTTDDEYDLIGKFRYNKSIGEYEPRMQKDGSVKTYADHLGNSDKIAKGILRDGLNIRENGGTIISDQIGTTLDDIYNFALILDEVAGVEISGFVLEAPVEKNKKIVQFEPYKDNSIDRSRTRIMDFAPYNVLQHFHTHGHADTHTIATTPSVLDLKFKNNQAVSLWPSIQFLILHNYGLPIKY